MFCEKCGNVLPDNAIFCDKCGAPARPKGAQSSENPSQGGYTAPGAGAFQNAGSTQGFDNVRMENAAGQQYSQYSPHSQHAQDAVYMEPSAYSRVFIDPDEQLLGTLGNGYLENILFKRVKKCHALLTDKRVYFQGIFFIGSGKNLTQFQSEKVVDVEDITGTGFIYSKPLGILASLLAVLLPWILFLIFGMAFGGSPEELLPAFLGLDLVVILFIIIRYILDRKTYFSIEYAGGEIRFDAQIVGLPAVRDFQKQIRRAKDKAKGKV